MIRVRAQLGLCLEGRVCSMLKDILGGDLDVATRVRVRVGTGLGLPGGGCAMRRSRR